MVAMQAGRCDDTISVFIHIDGDYGAIADGEREVALLAEGQEKVFTQAPNRGMHRLVR